jgi:uncharacterized repeat protein (TIGR03803 family)
MAGARSIESLRGGVLTVLHSFGQTASDGSGPVNRPVQGPDGNFYGSTPYGGTSGNGTLYKITPGGTFTKLHNFTGGADGAFPVGLVLGSDGSLYGTTEEGAASGVGTAYKLGGLGNLNVLHTFSGPDGEFPFGLMQHTNGTFYGLTNVSTTAMGTIFSLSVGLSPFVSALPFIGSPGATVTILGTGLTGTTSVSFNGTAATFTVDSDTEITVTVPAGAASGKITVTTPSGTLLSNVAFRAL